MFFRETADVWRLFYVEKGTIPTCVEISSLEEIDRHDSKDWYILRDRRGAMTLTAGPDAVCRAIIGRLVADASGVQVFRSLVHGWVSRALPSGTITMEIAQEVTKVVRRNWVISCFALLDRFRTTAAKISLRMPKGIQHLVLQLLRPIYNFLIRRLTEGLVANIRKESQNMIGRQDVADVMIKNSLPPEPSQVVDFVGTILMGRAAYAMEEFPDDHEWIVD